MDRRLETDTTRAILERGACGITGARERTSREFARINRDLPLAEKLQKIARAGYMSMGVPELMSDGTIKIDAVSYVYEGKFACGCANFRRLKRDYPVSRRYCYCCGGHFKYHYQIMLGLKLALIEVAASPLDTDGAEPCAFKLRIEGEANGE